MSIYLYIKQHTITGKLYFGKTIKNPETYFGSGLHWSRHLKKHGKEHVVNLWYHLFESQEECTSFALEFSESMNIVESDQWLNLKPENGLDGGVKGFKHSLESKEKNRIAQTGKTLSDETINKISKSVTGKTHTIKSKIKMSESRRNAPKLICPHCNKTGAPNNMHRYHFDACKLRS